MDIFLKFYGAIGTVSNDFDITYKIYGDDATQASTVKYYISDVTIVSDVEQYYEMTDLEEEASPDTDVTTTITQQDIQIALGKSGTPSDGAYILKLEVLDASNAIIESSRQIFVWQNDPIRIDLGEVTAYAAAVRGGFTGDYDLFCKAIAAFANNAYLLEQLDDYKFLVVDDYVATGLDRVYYGLYGAEYTSWDNLVNQGVLILNTTA